MARQELGRQELHAGEYEAAEASLREAITGAVNPVVALRLLARALSYQGRREEAVEALSEAARRLQTPCSLLSEWAQIIEAPRRRLKLAEDLVRCGKPRKAAEILLRLSRPQEALKLLSKEESPAAQRLKAQALLALGRLPEAKTLLAAQRDPESLFGAADLEAALTRRAPKEALSQLVRRFPTADQALDLMAAFPEWAPFAGLRLKTEAAIEGFEAQIPLPGPAVRVLDHSILLYFRDGKRLRWVHEILAIRSREAAETFGEIGLPTGVHLVALYTRKRDGRRLFAEESSEKESISLPDLKPGDYVVAIYLERGDNGYLYDSGFLSPRVFFRSLEVSSQQQRLEIFSFGNTAPQVQSLHGAPQGEALRLGARKGWRFERLREAAESPEPASPAPALWLPSLRVGSGVKLSADLTYMRDRILSLRRRNRAFSNWAQEAAGEGPLRSRLRRLKRAVQARIEEEGGLIETPVVEAWMRGRGSRALILSAALESLNIPHRLLMARPKLHSPEAPFEQLSSFPYPLLETSVAWIDPSPDRAPLGFFPFRLEGGDALVIWPPWEEEQPISLPKLREIPERRQIQAKLRWGADGLLRGEVEERLEGQEAIVIGQYLSRFKPKQKLRLLEHLLLRSVGAAKIIDWRDPKDDDPQGPLILRYRFEAQVGARLELGLFPLSPGRNYAGGNQRKSPLFLELPVHQSLELSLESERPFEGGAELGVLAWKGMSYEIQGEQGGRQLRLKAQLKMPGGMISPQEYPGFARWARKIDKRERLHLKIKGHLDL